MSPLHPANPIRHRIKQSLLAAGLLLLLNFSLHAEDDLLARSRELLSHPDTDAPALAALQTTCLGLLVHPTAALSENSAWMPLVENVAVASFRSQASDFAASKAATLTWLQAISQGAIGNRSERATLCARIWQRFLGYWADRAPQEVRAALNSPPIDLHTGVTRAQQESGQFAEVTLRADFLDQVLRDEKPPDLDAMKAEFARSLKESGTDAGIKAATISHYARLLLTTGDSAQALTELAKNWNELMKTPAASKLLCTAFFIYWYGTGDRLQARKMLTLADTMVASGQISRESTDLAAMRTAYYRGLPLTSDQLLLLRQKSTPRL